MRELNPAASELSSPEDSAASASRHNENAGTSCLQAALQVDDLGVFSASLKMC